MDNPKYLWIQTRDGSPTLWSNELGESFRSVKGAFVESWVAFVGPAFDFARTLNRPVIIGEFGLGPGTNWVLSTVAAALLGLTVEYHVIEKDLESFEMGLERWSLELARIEAFVREQLSLPSLPPQLTLAQLPQPQVYRSLGEALQPTARFQADVWFHDPFGFDVNPEGYAPNTLQACSELWAPRMWGGSYACNRHFKESLETLAGVSSKTVLTGSPLLKRERLEFRRV